jgi:hypothetical protein
MVSDIDIAVEVARLVMRFAMGQYGYSEAMWVRSKNSSLMGPAGSGNHRASYVAQATRGEVLVKV